MSDCGDLLAWSPKLRKDQWSGSRAEPEDILPPSGPGYKCTVEGTGAPGEGEPGVSKSRNVQGTFIEEDRQNSADGWGQKGPWRAHGEGSLEDEGCPESRAPSWAWNKGFDKISWKHALGGSYVTRRWGDLGRSGVFPGDSLLLMVMGSPDGAVSRGPCSRTCLEVRKLYFHTQAEDSHVSGIPGAGWAQELRPWLGGSRVSGLHDGCLGEQSGPSTSVFRRACCSALVHDNC